MSAEFPFLGTAIPTSQTTLPLFKIWAWDFDTNSFIRDGNGCESVKLTDGVTYTIDCATGKIFDGDIIREFRADGSIVDGDGHAAGSVTM